MAVTLLKFAAGAKRTAVNPATDDIAVRGVEVADGYGLSSQSANGTIDIGTDANTDAVDIGRTGQTTTVKGDLVVEGTTFTVEAETVRFEDNYLYINDGYTADAAHPGGMVVNYDPDPGTYSDTVTTGGFTGAQTVATTLASGLSAGDFVQISGAANTNNNGLFEVASHSGNVLTVKAAGVAAEYCQDTFTPDSTAQGTLTKVSVSVIRAGTDGVWEVGQGATSAAVSFQDLGIGTPTLDDAYNASGGASTVAVDAGSVTWSLTNNHDFVIDDGSGNDLFRADSSAPAVLLGNATTNPAVTQSGSGQVTFSGNVDATNGLDVTTAALTAAAGFTVSGGAVDIDCSTFALDPTDNVTVSMDATKTIAITLADDLDAAFTIGDGTNTIFEIETDAGTPANAKVKFGYDVELTGAGLDYHCYDVSNTNLVGLSDAGSSSITSGASAIGVYAAGWTNISPAANNSVQEALDSVDSLLTTALGDASKGIYQIGGTTITTTATQVYAGQVVKYTYDTDHVEVSGATTSADDMIIGLMEAAVAGDTSLDATHRVLNIHGQVVTIDTTNVRNEAWVTGDIGYPCYLTGTGKITKTAPSTGDIWQVGVIAGTDKVQFQPQRLAEDIS